MANLKCGIQLQEGEQLIFELEAELWATSHNPIAKLIGRIWRLLALIFGTKRHGWLVITDRRVIEVATVTACWCFEVNRNVKYVLPSSVKEVGYEKEKACCLFCDSVHFYYEGFTQTTRILLPFGEETGIKIVDAFYNAISHAQH